MRMPDAEWRKLRGPFLLLAATVVAMLLLVYARYQHESIAANQLQQQTKRLDLAIRRYQDVERQHAAMAELHALIQRLRVTPGEISTKWMQHMKVLEADHGDLDIRFSPGLAMSVPLVADMQGSAFQLHRSVMKLSLVVSHERELLSLLQTMREAVTTPFLLRGCEIQRNQPDLHDGNSHLYVACDLDWITLATSEQDKALSR